MQKVRKAVIPAAGFGTRFLPATKSMPKEMFPIVETPTLQYIVEEIVESGIEEILIILGRNKKCIEDHFDKAYELEDILRRTGKIKELNIVQDLNKKANFCYVRQLEMKGSAKAVLQAETFVANEPFAVLFGDDLMYSPKKPCLKQLIEAYETTGKSIVGVQTVSREDATKYGVVIPGMQKGRYTEIKGLVEKPSIDNIPSTLASLGRFVFTPDIFDHIKTTQPHTNGEYYLTDSILSLANSVGVFAYDFEARRYDIGDKQGFIEANIEYALRDNELKDNLATYLKNLVKNMK